MPERYAPYELKVLPQAPSMRSYFTVTPTGMMQTTSQHTMSPLLIPVMLQGVHA